MKNQKRFLILLTLLSALFYFGCTPTVSNFQEAEVFGPHINNSVKITEEKERGDLDLNLNFSINNVSKISSSLDGHTKVNSNNIYELEPVAGEDYFLERANINIYEFEGENLTWELPKVHGLVNIDLALSNHFAVTGGVSYSKYNSENFWGNNFGVAFFDYSNDWSYRFDWNVSFQEMRFNSFYVTAEDKELSGNETRRVYLKMDTKKEQYGDFSFMLSINSNKENWPINVFFSYKLGSQTFYETSIDNILFNGRRIGDFEYEESYQAFSLGIYQNVFDAGRIIIGYKYTIYNDKKDNFSIPQAFIQYDFRIF